MPGAMIHEEVDGSVGDSDSRESFIQRFMDISNSFGNSVEVTNHSMLSESTRAFERFAMDLYSWLGIVPNESVPIEVYERRARELLGLGGSPPATNNSIVLSESDPAQACERRVRVLHELGRAPPGTDNSIVLRESDPTQVNERRVRKLLGLGDAPPGTNGSIVLSQSDPIEFLMYERGVRDLERQRRRGISLMMLERISVDAADMEAGLIGENRRIENNQAKNLFHSRPLAKVILGIAGQAIFSLLGLALTNSHFSLEYKILAIALAIGYTGSLISMLIPKGKLQECLVKVGAVSVSSAVIGSMAMLLRVDKMWMWIIAGTLSLLLMIAVILS